MVRNEPVTGSVEDSNEPHIVLLPHAVLPVSMICACMDILFPDLNLTLLGLVFKSPTQVG